MDTTLPFRRRSHGQPALYLPPPLLLVLPSTVQQILHLRPTTPFPMSMVIISTRSVLAQLTTLPRLLAPSAVKSLDEVLVGASFLRVFGSVEFLPASKGSVTPCGIVSFQNMAPTSSRQVGKVSSSHDTWAQPESTHANSQDLALPRPKHECEVANEVVQVSRTNPIQATWSRSVGSRTTHSTSKAGPSGKTEHCRHNLSNSMQDSSR